MTTSAELRGLFVDALKGATDAGQAVYSPFDWPTAPTAYPSILVHARKERKVSLGPNAPQFDVYTTVEVIARTKAPAGPADSGSAVALAAAERLKAQIEVTLINNPAIWSDPAGGQRVEQFTSIDSEINTSSEGDMPIAELSLHIEAKFYQGPVDFYPIPTVPLQTVNVHFDSVEPFDSRGQYPDPPFPEAVQPGAPVTLSDGTPVVLADGDQVTQDQRLSGPDGRDEGALTITLPQ
ncbi:ABC transporter permease [Cupriavidus basilensis]|uniref:ABC transporter permease n=1 Tax=Cupriavidus basilensis TaxID=68895 RepID=A0A643G4M5_9BURK|nr:ABC transporter permease [Cupriavidus basilensis]QOT75058.1 ABC transporter permease [Cupriavidus basilensis]